MKKPKIIGFFFVIGLFIILFSQELAREEPVLTEHSHENGQISGMPEPLDIKDERKYMESKLGAFSDEEVDLKPEKFSWEAWAYAIGYHRIEMSENGPIEFYGKVVDEEGEPIPGVSIEILISYNEPSLRKVVANFDSGRQKTVFKTTDFSGLFSLKGEVGRNITIKNFKKEGYGLVGKRKF